MTEKEFLGAVSKVWPGKWFLGKTMSIAQGEQVGVDYSLLVPKENYLFSHSNLDAIMDDFANFLSTFELA